jgi:acetylglutamate kinase
MKIVIKITNLSGKLEPAVKFGRATASLFQDAHSLVVVHGDHRENLDGDFASTNGACSPSDQAMTAVTAESRQLVAILRRAGLSSLGICGGDGDLCEVRKKALATGRHTVEVTHVSPRWVEVICGNGGVPVISNLVLASWGEHYLIDADKLAAALANSWSADALIYLTTVDGVKDTNGATIRWLNLEYIEFLKTQSALAHGMLFKLNACKEALESGVRRVRLLPISHVDSLPSFFFSRIDFGTEVIAMQR